jgi:hydroxymethylglutaryl-CoA lyase
VATEDVLYLLNGLGIKTGVDLNKILETSKYIMSVLNRNTVSKVSLAMQTGKKLI